MRLEKITRWLDGTLKVKDFSDVSNNGVQIARRGTDVTRVAFAVDASRAAVAAAAERGAQLLVVHHGISWGGGMTRLTGGLYETVRAAIEADLALYAVHLPLDAHPRLGNNACLARRLGVRRTRPAFVYHGETIGLIGTAPARALLAALSDFISPADVPDRANLTVGICSGGAGSFAPEAGAAGCDVYVTGEADWGETIAAENAGIPLVCAGHYATETLGVKAVAAAMERCLRVETVYLPRPDEPDLRIKEKLRKRASARDDT